MMKKGVRMIMIGVKKKGGKRVMQIKGGGEGKKDKR